MSWTPVTPSEVIAPQQIAVLPPEFAQEPIAEPAPRLIPTLADTFIFAMMLACTGAVVMFVMGIVFAVDKHLAAEPTNSKLLLIAIPAETFWYVLAAAIVLPLFAWRWRVRFRDGIHWNAESAGARLALLVAAGIALGLFVELTQRFLPMPKTVPIDVLFTTQTGAWLATIFGTLIAPLAEETAFRGFLLPSIRNSMPRNRMAGAVIGTLLTSALFAAMHSGQLATAWAPLAVLFAVSVVLCVIRLRFASLAASTLVHACYNGTLFATMLIATGGYRHLEKLHS
jgi:hypothetical protein